MNIDALEPMAFADSRSWREWLAGNHGERKDAWLHIRKKNKDARGIPYPDALEEALCFGWIDGKMHGFDDDSYILRFTPRRARSAWSKTNREKAEMLITSGRMTDAGLVKIEEARNKGNWTAAATDRSARNIKPGT